MKCPNCGHYQEHWNSAMSLPPVGIWFAILYYGDTEVEVFRNSYSPRPDGTLEYATREGKSIIGRFQWKYL